MIIKNDRHLVGLDDAGVRIVYTALKAWTGPFRCAGRVAMTPGEEAYEREQLKLAEQLLTEMGPLLTRFPE